MEWRRREPSQLFLPDHPQPVSHWLELAKEEAVNPQGGEVNLEKARRIIECKAVDTARGVDEDANLALR
ncbi:MAG: hypothetical protein GDYSWBUE_001375 [Candidatus Fervidibacterota bacterium]